VSRYLRLLGIFWRSAVATELEYRVNFLSNTVMSLFWVTWAGIGISVYFRFTDSVAGWSYADLLVVVGLFFTVNGLRQAVFSPNLERMTEYVRNGTLDFLLTKPVDAQFMASFRHLGVYNVLDPFIGLGLAVVGLVLGGRGITPASLGAFAVTMLAAVLVLYALTLASMALAVRLVSSEGIDEVSFAFVEASRFPVQLYRQPVQALLTVVPVAFLTTLPAMALLGRLAPGWLLAAPAVGVASVLAASAAWRASLRGYSGASS
jgi:ABC-2 type transport system permease protein